MASRMMERDSKKKSGTILIVDDEAFICKSLSHIVEKEGYSTVSAYNGKTALKLFHTAHPDLILLDLKLPGIEGMALLKHVIELEPDIPVIIITANASVTGAVSCIKNGAFDYLAKPFNHEEVTRLVNRGVESKRLKTRVRELSSQNEKNSSLIQLMGSSEAISQLVFKVNRVAMSDFTVIVAGESGSGKELVASAIHQASRRKKGPFIAVDCGAIPETLLESELFGHEKGAFTGADKQKPGKFELAKNGTLFLDEISNLTLGSQAKLLRALQEKTVNRVGSIESFDVDVRVLVASNSELSTPVHGGSFRKDLFYRLNEFTIKVPSLRNRKEDIPYLASRFLDECNIELDKHVEGFSDSAITAMLSYDWPGNVRQLRSAVKRASLLADDMIEDHHLDIQSQSLSQNSISAITGSSHPWIGRSLKEIVQESTIALEREVIVKLLEHTEGNKAKAARLLQVDYKTLHTKAKQFGI